MWPATLLKICLLRANPQDLPISTWITALTLAIYGAADVAMAWATVPLARALQAAVVDTFLLMALVQVTLHLRKFGARVRQTLMALAGCGALLAIPTFIATGLGGGDSPSIVWVPLLLWLVAVYGHILRHALEVRYALGITAACVYILISLVVTGPFLISPVTN